MKKLLSFWEYEEIDYSVNLKLLVETGNGINCLINWLSMNRAIKLLSEDSFSWIVYLNDKLSSFSISALKTNMLDYKSDLVECTLFLTELNETNIALANLISIAASLEESEIPEQYSKAIVSVSKWLGFSSNLIKERVYLKIDELNENTKAA